MNPWCAWFPSQHSCLNYILHHLAGTKPVWNGISRSKVMLHGRRVLMQIYHILRANMSFIIVPVPSHHNPLFQQPVYWMICLLSEKILRVSCKQCRVYFLSICQFGLSVMTSTLCTIIIVSSLDFLLMQESLMRNIFANRKSAFW